MKPFIVLSILLICISVLPMQKVSIQIRTADQALIPLSSRSMYATVKGTQNRTVRWAVTGGCNLENALTDSAPGEVFAPAYGSRCQLSGEALSKGNPNFSSATSCVVTATALADPHATAKIILPICNPDVAITTFPESSVLYERQFAVIQSDVRGSTNTGVSWTLTSNPRNGGLISGGTTNRHAVFSATLPGVYVLAATSKADTHRVASSTIYVTSHEMPPSPADHTEPVDCTASGDGPVLDVGPKHPIRDLSLVPWAFLSPGTTVRIFNDDATTRAPTTYHQHIAIAATGTASQPLRICGVPDAHGVKPILDADGAISPPVQNSDWSGPWLQNLGLIVVYDRRHKWDTSPDGSHNLLIEGLHLRNVSPAYKFHRQGDGVLQPYDASAACIHVHTGRSVLLRGNELENCGQGIFVNSQTPEGSIVYDLTIEGNYIHGWGLPHYGLDHALYLQAIGATVQFNYFGEAHSRAAGSVIKSRSVLNFIRWNYVEVNAATARAFDLVEPQGFACYVTSRDFALYRTSHFGDCNAPPNGVRADPVTADQVAANYESYRSDYVYGNVIEDEGSRSAFVHYAYDQEYPGSTFDRRSGTLFYWNNTHLLREAGQFKRIFDPEAPDSGESDAYPSIMSVNNIFATASRPSTYQWLKSFWPVVTVDSNWISGRFQLPNRTSHDIYQGGFSHEEAASCNIFGFCKPGQGHMRWKRQGVQGAMETTLYMGSMAIDSNSFLPLGNLRGLGGALPSGIEDQPSNMVFYPNTGVIATRNDRTVLGALD